VNNLSAVQTAIYTALTYAPLTGIIISPHDLTNAAWVKRGAVGVAKTATGPDGIANSATAVTNLGALGVDDVFQSASGYGATARFEPRFWLKKVTASGTLRINNPSAVTGRWDVNLASVGTGWESITRSHAAVTIVSEFVSTAGGDGGLHFMAQAGGPLAVNLWGCDTEIGTSPSATYPVYDAVPQGVAKPYIVIGEMTEMPDEELQVATTDASINLHTWSAYVGKSQSHTLLQYIRQRLDNVAIAGTWFFAEDFVEIMEDAGSTATARLYHGVARYRVRV
jgi:hypothetical protein